MADSYFAHTGTPQKFDFDPHGSGRFRQGSGKNPNQHESFSESLERLKKQGIVTEKEICNYLGMKTQDYRAYVTVNKAKTMADLKRKCLHYRNDEQMSTDAIAKKLGISETNVRNYLKDDSARKAQETLDLVERVKKEIADHRYVEAGPGIAANLNISEQKLKNVIKYLELEEGYTVSTPRLSQMSTDDTFKMKIIAPPGTSHKEIRENIDKAYIMDEWHVDKTGDKNVIMEKHNPVNIAENRIMIRYNEEGGVLKDGVIELRPGVKELSMGKSIYAQVRIATEHDRYLKGMAVYGDPKDFPPGVDIIYNSNKHLGASFVDATKAQDLKNPLNPFGSAIQKQNDWRDENGEYHHGALNIVREEGAWTEYANRLPSQFLSKQPVKLAKQQLDLDVANKKEDYNQIMQLSNPIIKKDLLISFADECDSSAAHLKAAALPRQGHHIILPILSMKENEVYAPGYREGETVVMVRFPHSGQFEIAECKVNNHNKEALKVMGGAKDAVGIHPHVAAILNGADFDGDTVLVIPNPHTTRDSKTGKSQGAIKTQPFIKELADFEPKEIYKGYEGMKVISKKSAGREMGKVTNLLNDMSVKGNANMDDIVAVAKYTKVIIDANKHKLDYKQAYKDLGIEAIRKRYQVHDDDPTKYGGAQTLLSRAKSPVTMAEMEQDKKSPIKENGEKNMVPTGKYHTFRDGAKVAKTMEVYKMDTVSDARELMSGPNHIGTPMERVYANYANSMKSMANEARKEAYSTPAMEWDPVAKSTYKNEVASINAKLLNAKKNAPLERKAKAIANIQYREYLDSHPDETKEEKKKTKGRLLAPAREAVGAKKARIELSPKEVEAMNAGALSPSHQREVFRNMDDSKKREAFTPRAAKKLTSAQKSRIKALYKLDPKTGRGEGYTQEQIAQFLGVSVSTVNEVLLNA